MEDAAARAAAQLLLSSWQAGTRISALPRPCRPTSRIDGYSVQSALQSLTGDSLVGWKIAATSPAGQAHIGVDGPLAGRLLGRRVRSQREHIHTRPQPHACRGAGVRVPHGPGSASS